MTVGFPAGRRFAFTIMDDTDVATVANVKPVYDLLFDLGFRTTKTVWPFAWRGSNSNFESSETLEDAPYLKFVQELAERGFEIASHGATMQSSERPATQAALNRLVEVFGSAPRVYANHATNRENLYWGVGRIDNPLLRVLYSRVNGRPADFYQGHVQGTPWWWGDLCQMHHEYVRNLTFTHLNILRANPTVPYHDPRRPLVPWWFSAADAENCEEFVRVCRRERVNELEAEGGVCILATHFGKGYTKDGVVDARFRAILEDIAGRKGWFVPVGQLLDYLRAQRTGAEELSPSEWRRMQWKWAQDLLARRLGVF